MDTSTGLTTTNVATLGVAGNDTCAVTTTGQAYCWGWNANGQVGDNTSGTDRLTPTPVNTTTGLSTTNVARISNAGTHVCAVTTTGQAYCWGANSNGQIGDNTSGTDRLTPTRGRHHHRPDHHQRHPDRTRSVHLRGHHHRAGLLLGRQQQR